MQTALFLSKYSLHILLAWLAVYLLIKLWGGKSLQKTFLVFSAIVYAVLLLRVTLLGRESGEEMRCELELFWEYRQAFQFEAGRLKIQNIEYAWYIRDNILLCIPLGVLLRELFQASKKHAFFRVVVIGCLISLLIETCQLVFRIGLFEVDDILNNCIGTAVGFFVYGLGSWLMRNKP